MIFEDKTIILKNGESAVLRSPNLDDAETMLSYIKTASGETEFLLMLPEEYTQDLEAEGKWIKSINDSPYAMLITCFVGKKAVGNVEIRLRGPKKTRHRASLAIAVLKEFWGQGVSSSLFEEIIAVAKEKGVEILELEYIEGNERAKRFYGKFGFKAVAELPNAFRQADGSMRKAIQMQKYLY